MVFSSARRRAVGRQNRKPPGGAERRAERAGGLAAMARPRTQRAIERHGLAQTMAVVGASEELVNLEPRRRLRFDRGQRRPRLRAGNYYERERSLLSESRRRQDGLVGCAG